MSTKSNDNMKQNQHVIFTSLQEDCGACVICAPLLLELDSSDTVAVASSSTADDKSEDRRCTICLGILSYSSLRNETRKSIMKAFEPYHTFGDGMDMRLSQEAPTVSIPSMIMLRAYAARCHVEQKVPRGSSRFCSPSAFYTRAKTLIKSTILSNVQKDLAKALTGVTSTGYVPSDPEEGCMNFHVLFISSDLFPDCLTCEDPNWAKNKHRQMTRKRFRGSDPTLKQGGDTRANLEERVRQHEQNGTGVNEFYPSHALVEKAINSTKGQSKETRLALAQWIAELAKDISSDSHRCTAHTAAWRHAFYLAGRYTKASRNVPQSPFYVPDEATGKLLRKGVSSVEEEICTIVADVCGGISTTNNVPSKHDNIVYGICKLHASGREDIDVRMLAVAGPQSGRPFVCEVIDAHSLPSKGELQLAVRRINQIGPEEKIYTNGLYGRNEVGVGIDSLSFTTAARFSGLQAETENKVKHYGCLCWSEKSIPNQEHLDKLLTRDTVTPIIQATPIRVLHRRAAADRHRAILKMEARRTDDHWFHLKLSTSAGTYVKEFVHGDLGRTRPSVASILGCKADILELDCEGIDASESPLVGG